MPGLLSLIRAETISSTPFEEDLTRDRLMVVWVDTLLERVALFPEPLECVLHHLVDPGHAKGSPLSGGIVFLVLFRSLQRGFSRFRTQGVFLKAGRIKVTVRGHFVRARRCVFRAT